MYSRLFNQANYNSTKSTIISNINGRICHHRVYLLKMIAEQEKIRNYLEVGVHNGASMSYVVHQTNSKINKCIGLDLFEDTFYKDKITIENSRNNIERNNISNSNVILVKCNSNNPNTLNQVNRILNGEELDLLFIDGDHKYNGVKTDCLLYSRLLKKGGLLVFDDFGPRHPGVYKFLNEFIKENNEFEIIDYFTDYPNGHPTVPDYCTMLVLKKL